MTTAGKSGTAELGGTGEPHSWFIGFAPAEDPKVAIAVIVEQAGRGGEVAAPIAGEPDDSCYLKGRSDRRARRAGPSATPPADRDRSSAEPPASRAR